jgi:hypothetical protein
VLGSTTSLTAPLLVATNSPFTKFRSGAGPAPDLVDVTVGLLEGCKPSARSYPALADYDFDT